MIVVRSMQNTGPLLQLYFSKVPDVLLITPSKLSYPARTVSGTDQSGTPSSKMSKQVLAADSVKAEPGESCCC
ncbi:hypothetical protein KC361_g207 [Hortaea werneckii]|nr:hypothetical protein KC361_g207 [Hortaea werneckii]